MLKWYRYVKIFVALAFFIAWQGTVLAQEPVSGTEVGQLSPEEEEALRLEILARITQFNDDFDQLLDASDFPITVQGDMISKSLVDVMKKHLNYLSQSYDQLTVKWTTYYQAQQIDIANNEEMMDLVANIEKLKTQAKDTLDNRIQTMQAISDFVEADNFIISQVNVYKNLYRKAFRLSLIEKLTPQLEKVKAKEQVLFTELQTRYDQAKAASAQMPGLSKRMKMLEDQFVVMKSVSEKVQALEYKPFVERVKDYVMGMAAVSIILLFLNGVVTRIGAYRDKVASAKKYKEMLNNGGKEKAYPTI